MREILFKAKRIDNGEWVEGYYTFINNIHYIYTGSLRNGGLYVVAECFEINPETVCQYTGLTDKNGKRIWENDIVECVNKNVVISGGPYHSGYRFGDKLKVKCLDSGFTLLALTNNSEIPNTCGNVKNYEFWNMQHFLKVIGNIFDNPELLGESE